MTSLTICSIVANNYVAYARVLTRSLQERAPGARALVLIVDGRSDQIDYASEPFEAVFPEQLELAAFRRMAFEYDILELSTAVKPWFLKWIHRTYGLHRLIYFDPDILITGDLGPLEARLREGADVVLTPHVLAPLEDGRTPGEIDFLLSGIYNLGFLGISFNERTLPFLDWWHRRLERECYHQVDRGLFVDQRWMDFAPAFLPHAEVCRDPGWNVAYWNLAHRSIAHRNGEWFVGESPLRFFHFSGFQFGKPEAISRFQDRYTLADRPDLGPLFREYDRRLAEAGHTDLRTIPYRYGRFDDGTPIPPVARRALREIDPQSRRWTDPFAAAGADTFLRWLLEPDSGAGELGLPRAALLLWSRRPDLQQAFSEPTGRHRRDFAGWLVANAEDPPLPERFLARLRAALIGPGRDEAIAHQLSTAPAAAGALLRGLPAAERGWLLSDAVDERARPRVARLAMMLYRGRRDLERAYPQPLAKDRLRFAIWFLTAGALEYRVPPAMLLSLFGTLPPRAAAWTTLWWARRVWRRRRRLSATLFDRRAEPAPVSSSPTEDALRGIGTGSHSAAAMGINVVGWIDAPTGVGEASRGTLAASSATGLPTATWNLGRSAAETPRDPAPDGLPYDVTLLHVNADMTEQVVRRLPTSTRVGRSVVGYWFWELAHFPEHLAGAFAPLDEVWAPSRFCESAFRALAPIDVRWVPPPVERRRAVPAHRGRWEIPTDAFLLLFAFDALSVPARKNPGGLLRAFARAVERSPKPLHLLLKVNHADPRGELLAELRRLARGLPVTIVAESLSRAEMDGLLTACDAYVSLHRSEGLGLPLIEAMMMGKPVVATGYGGCADFLDDSTGWVVNHRMQRVGEGAAPYQPAAVWADPDPDHAAFQIVAVAQGGSLMAARCAAARDRVDRLYGMAAAGGRLRDEVVRLLERPLETRGPRPSP